MNENIVEWQRSEPCVYVCVTCGVVLTTAVSKCVCGAERVDAEFAYPQPGVRTLLSRGLIRRPSGLHTIEDLIRMFATQVEQKYQPELAGLRVQSCNNEPSYSPVDVATHIGWIHASYEAYIRDMEDMDEWTCSTRNYLAKLEAEQICEKVLSAGLEECERLRAECKKLRNTIEKQNKVINYIDANGRLPSINSISGRIY